jgi:predicted permease
MTWFRILLVRSAATFRKKRLEGELEDELRAHLAMLVEENVRRGMSPDGARCAALRSFGGLEQVKEEYREQRGLPTMETLAQDLRYGLRQLRRNPGFTMVAVLTLALGIGANTAIFSVVNAVLIRPLPYPHASRLTWISQEIRELKAEIAAGADYLDWREQNHTFDDMAAYDESGSFNLTGRGRPERVVGALVSASFFSTLGVQPRVGRAFTVEEDRPGAPKVAVITYGFWKRRLGSDPHVLGQRLSLNGESYTVTGVMPASFRFPGNSTAELLLPLALNPERERQRQMMRIVRVVGLLKPDVTVARAREDLNLISERNRPKSGPGQATQAVRGPAPANAPAPPGRALVAPAPSSLQHSITPSSGSNVLGGTAPSQPATPPPGRAHASQVTSRGQGPGMLGPPPRMMPHFELKVVPLQEHLVGAMRVALMILLGAVGLVLLIACANVANLLVTRASLRSREIAVRAALGAGRARLVRQLLTESVLLSSLGGGLGLVLATWGVRAIIGITPARVAGDIFRPVDVRIDATVLGFTTFVSIVTGILFGLAPAFTVLKADLSCSLKEGSGPSLAIGGNRVRGAFVVLQCALALVLLAGAGLLLKSFYRLLRVDPGFSAEKVLTMVIQLPEMRYPMRSPQAAGFFDQLLKRAETLPSVSSAGVTSSLPLTGYNSLMAGIEIEGRAPQPPGADPVIAVMAISADYLRTMGIPVIKGRAFSDADAAGSPKVVLVNETMARHFWPDRDPLGRRVGMGARESPQEATIVGVVADVRHEGLTGDVRPQMYQPYLQAPWNSMSLALRTAADPTQVVNAIRQAVWSLDSEQPVYDVSTMEQRLSDSVAPRRFNLVFLGTFAGLALALAGVGIYGVMSYTVTARTHEIGVRMALGAARGDVLKLVVGQAVALAVLGVAVGIVAAFGVTRLISSLLYETRATDLVTFAAVSLILLVVAFLAAFIPARRATLVDPMLALRHE